MKTIKSQQRHNKLYDIAEAQEGYFTAKQAETAGFLPTNYQYHVRTGAWIREDRGIYRLKNFPMPARGQLIHYLLWSRDRSEKIQGVYSHETALTIHELSDVMPAKLHMTVPTTFRKSVKIPKVLILYYKDIDPEDVEYKNYIRVTKPLATILDLIQTKTTSFEFVEQALVQGVIRGLIPIGSLKSEKIPKEIRTMFNQWLAHARAFKKVAGD